ncbi:hypothetical protein [Filimonas lacunae]|uniref:hypothetical protein n=1 Tax=Filimonas lacunae TaxID=477680 RepID=UPI0007D71E53|nr:hypothetical protein [Filimonas lacunae]BAV07956.1 hypothetical protein FLA_3988 [Filimonas lacunae]
MKPNKTAILIAVQTVLCLLEAYLISKISLLGKLGIAMFYKQYRFLRSGWKTFLLLLAIQLLLTGILTMAKKRLSHRKVVYTGMSLLLIGMIALWGTYYDFQYTFSHRLLKEKFHLGFYLFWLGWIGTCLFFLVKRAEKGEEPVVSPLQEEGVE